jgi:deoxyribose-phosphate aldolase
LKLLNEEKDGLFLKLAGGIRTKDDVENFRSKVDRLGTSQSVLILSQF